jgi:hypothetical protein
MALDKRTFCAYHSIGMEGQKSRNRCTQRVPRPPYEVIGHSPKRDALAGGQPPHFGPAKCPDFLSFPDAQSIRSVHGHCNACPTRLRGSQVVSGHVAHNGGRQVVSAAITMRREPSVANLLVCQKMELLFSRNSTSFVWGPFNLFFSLSGNKTISSFGEKQKNIPVTGRRHCSVDSVNGR